MYRILLLSLVTLLVSCQDAQNEGRRDSRDATELGDTQALTRPLPSDTPNSQRLNRLNDSTMNQ